MRGCATPAQLGPQSTVFLRGTGKPMPCRITQDGTGKRWLTGADFEP